MNTRVKKVETVNQSIDIAPSQITVFNAETVRADFPILARTVYDKPLVYLDNAASAQKPRCVIEAMKRFLEEGYANVHRGLHYLSNAATTRFEESRERAARFLNARHPHEIVFTSGATDGINLVADSFGADFVEGDEIILSVMEHHSNIVPWHFLRERKGVVLKWVDIRDDGALDMGAYEQAFSPRTRMVALTHMSNALGTITPAKELVRIAHGHDVQVLLDGCQAAVHLGVDVQDLDVDFYVFSGHKIYGPTGIGVLYGKQKWLERMRPYRGGGEMIAEVTLDTVSYGDLPQKFEAGTPPIVGAIGLGAALDYIMALDRAAVQAHEEALLSYATECMMAHNDVRLFAPHVEKGSILSFTLEGTHPHDVSTIVDRSGVAIRAGHHCAQPVMDRFGVTATARASFAMYNTREDVDRLMAALDKAREFLK